MSAIILCFIVLKLKALEQATSPAIVSLIPWWFSLIRLQLVLCLGVSERVVCVCVHVWRDVICGNHGDLGWC